MTNREVLEKLHEEAMTTESNFKPATQDPTFTLDLPEPLELDLPTPLELDLETATMNSKTRKALELAQEAMAKGRPAFASDFAAWDKAVEAIDKVLGHVAPSIIQQAKELYGNDWDAMV